MRSLTILILCALAMWLAAPLARGAADEDAAKENPWQLLDVKDWGVLSGIGIKDDTPLEIGVGILRNALAHHQDPAVRATCAKVLGRLEVRGAAESLIWALNDRDAGVRGEAAKALGVLKEKRAIEPLANLLRKEPVADNRYAIILAFSVLADRQTGKILAEALVKDPDERVRAKSAEVLAAMQDKRAWRQLIQGLSDPEPSVRATCARALGVLVEKRALDELIAALQDEEPGVRAAAAGALGQLDSRKAVDPLIDLLQDDNVTVRHHAVGALGRLGSKRALKPIENLIKTESDINVVTAAKNAYKQITGDDWKGD